MSIGSFLINALEVSYWFYEIVFSSSKPSPPGIPRWSFLTVLFLDFLLRFDALDDLLLGSFASLAFGS